MSKPPAGVSQADHDRYKRVKRARKKAPRYEEGDPRKPPEGVAVKEHAKWLKLPAGQAALEAWQNRGSKEDS